MEKAIKNISGSPVKHPFPGIKYTVYVLSTTARSLHWFPIVQVFCLTNYAFSFKFSVLRGLSRLLKTPFDSAMEVKVSAFLFYHITVRSFTVKAGVLQNINITSLSSVRPTKKG